MLSIYVFSCFPFGFESRMWDLIVSVTDHCLSVYFAQDLEKYVCQFSAKWLTLNGPENPTLSKRNLRNRYVFHGVRNAGHMPETGRSICVSLTPSTGHGRRPYWMTSPSIFRNFFFRSFVIMLRLDSHMVATND